MNALEAQGISADKVRTLRGLTDDLEQLIQRMCENDRDLKAVLPLLTPAARDEVNSALENICAKAAAAFLSIANPAEDPA